MGKYKGFTQVELRKPKRAMFDLSHESRVSSRMGRLTPIFISETLPNDTFQVSSEVLIKLAPLVAPIFHRLNLYVHYFFVPNRLLWEDWEDFITGGRLGEAVETPPLPPRGLISVIGGRASGFLDVGSLADYLGVPQVTDAGSVDYDEAQGIDVMPFAAYQKVYMDYYRDRNYVADDQVVLPMPGGNIATAGEYDQYFTIRYRAWQHDYFTSAQTETQRGPEVLMPLAGTITDVRSAVDGTPLDASSYLGTGDGVGIPAEKLIATDFPIPTNAEAAELVLSGSTVTINEFRRAIALQQWLERNQLAGSRYNESIWAHFNRRTSDGRLQRAEYLGGGKAVIKIDEVLTTAYSEDAVTTVVPPATPTGRGSTYSTTNRFRYNCEEHGFIIGVLSVLPSSGYMQGLPRMFQRSTFLDYPWPTFANLGEQPVYDFELYMDPDSLDKIATGEFPIFGYQSRYADWKHMESAAHGDFRTTLDYWHLTRKFSGPPNLGEDFITFADSEQDRVFNVANVDTLWMYVYNNAKVVRSLPYFGVPAGLYPSAV